MIAFKIKDAMTGEYNDWIRDNVDETVDQVFLDDSPLVPEDNSDYNALGNSSPSSASLGTKSEDFDLQRFTSRKSSIAQPSNSKATDSLQLHEDAPANKTRGRGKLDLCSSEVLLPVEDETSPTNFINH